MVRRAVRKVICLAVASLFLLNDLCYGLGPGVVSGDLRPNGDDVQREMHAAGQKKVAANIGPGYIDYSAVSVVDDATEFVDVDAEHNKRYTIPDHLGIFTEKVEPGKLPPGLENSRYLKDDSFFRNLDAMKDASTGKISLVEALRYYMREEARIPDGELDIEEGYFEVDSSNGELGIMRIEPRKNKYVLIVHTDFVRRWNHVVENDVWFRYMISGYHERWVSLAWAIFFRVAKHEMTDLNKLTRLPKGEVPAHLTYHAEQGMVGVNSNEIVANSMQGRFKTVNDAIWMWFLGAYCFTDKTRYNNNVLFDRLDWFFGDIEAHRRGLDMEFPNLVQDPIQRHEAVSFALIVNKAFFGDMKKVPDQIRGPAEKRDDPKRKNLLRLADVIAKHIEYQRTPIIDDETLQRLSWDITDIVEDVIDRAIDYKNDNRGIKPSLQQVMSYRSPQSGVFYRAIREYGSLGDFNIIDDIRRISLLAVEDEAEVPGSPLHTRTIGGVLSWGKLIPEKVASLRSDVLRRLTGSGNSGSASYLLKPEFMELVKDRIHLNKLKEAYRTRGGGVIQALPATGGGEHVVWSDTRAKLKIETSLLKAEDVMKGITILVSRAELFDRDFFTADEFEVAANMAYLGAPVASPTSLNYRLILGELTKSHLNECLRALEEYGYVTIIEGGKYAINDAQRSLAIARNLYELAKMVKNKYRDSGIDPVDPNLFGDFSESIRREFEIGIRGLTRHATNKPGVITEAENIFDAYVWENPDAVTVIMEGSDVRASFPIPGFWAALKRATAESVVELSNSTNALAVEVVQPLVEPRDMLEVLDEYAVGVGLGTGPGADSEPLGEGMVLSRASMISIIALFKTQQVEIILPQHLEKALTPSTRATIEAFNRRLRGYYGTQGDAISINRTFNSSNLRGMLGGKREPNVKRVFVNDGASSAWFRELLEASGEEDIMGLKGERIITVEPSLTGDNIVDSVHQAWLVKVSILAALLNEDNKTTVGSALKDELTKRLVDRDNRESGEEDIDTYIDELAKGIADDTIKHIGYFLDRIVKLSFKVGEQLRILKAFWTAA